VAARARDDTLKTLITSRCFRRMEQQVNMKLKRLAE
jgi:hypothetical protein